MILGDTGCYWDLWGNMDVMKASGLPNENTLWAMVMSTGKLYMHPCTVYTVLGNIISG